MKLCNFGCGQYIEWNNNLGYYVNVDTAIKHDCPTFHRKGRIEPRGKGTSQEQPPRIIQTFEELQDEIVHELELALEHNLNALNKVSKTTFYDIIARPKDAQQN